MARRGRLADGVEVYVCPECDGIHLALTHGDNTVLAGIVLTAEEVMTLAGDLVDLADESRARTRPMAEMVH